MASAGGRSTAARTASEAPSAPATKLNRIAFALTARSTRCGISGSRKNSAYIASIPLPNQTPNPRPINAPTLTMTATILK
jgi:hypothetical protein